MPEPKTTECRYCHGTGLAPMGDGDDHPATKCGFCEAGRMPVRVRRFQEARWFDHWEDGASREHRGYQDDAEAERRANEQQGY